MEVACRGAGATARKPELGATTGSLPICVNIYIYIYPLDIQKDLKPF